MEVNFDGIVGPTHNYSGLSFGNIASEKHGGLVSHPKKAALQGLQKMKMVRDLGGRQAVLPPHERPHLPTVRALGYKRVEELPFELLKIVMSASPMWTANAFVSAPSCDTQDGRLHFVIANLGSELHRSIEAKETLRILEAIFSDKGLYEVHPPLPGMFPDEGAANHTRLEGAHIFVYGKSVFGKGKGPLHYPARQSLEASKATARLLGIEGRSIFLQQAPEAIDAGVFHNDVIATGHERIFLYHEKAFVEVPQIKGIEMVKVTGLTLKEVVNTYLFNSQILDNGIFLAAQEVVESPATLRWAEEELPKLGMRLETVDLRESMRNGGGPACLRNRVVMSEEEIERMNGSLLLTDALYGQLVKWVEKYYRDELHPEELSDPKLHEESREALDNLTQILQLGSIYDFQR